MDNSYKMSVKYAEMLLRNFPTKNINGKDAEDFVMEAIAQDGFATRVSIRCNIIDEARRKWGNSKRGKSGSRRIRDYEDALFPNKICVHDPDTPMMQQEEINDIVARMPRLTDQQHTVVVGLCSGIAKADIAKQLRVSPTRVTQLIDELVEALLGDKEWHGILSRHVSRNGSSLTRSKTLAS